MSKSSNKAIGVAVAIFAAFGLAGTASAATVTATASATVLATMTIAQTQALSFGTFAGNTGGTITLTSAGARSSTGTVVFPTGSAAAVGKFSVTGTGTNTFGISYVDGSLTGAGSPMALAVSGVASNPTVGTLSGGAASFDVGGILTVGSNQAAGTYNGTYTVTVDYN
ncbi:MAG: YapH protein [Paucimonas sp.]|nr:YapH protein [Paucimonas sp.]